MMYDIIGTRREVFTLNEEIKKIILQKRPDIDNLTLNYYLNYFSVITEENLIPESITLEDLIKNALTYANKIEFYDENHRVAKENGLDVKGYRDPETKTIYIRDNLGEPLREITVYHELHHAVQTNPKNNEVGINQSYNMGRLIMEAQTQNIAEKIYSKIHNVTFPEREIPSENLRMLSNGIVISSLHNYEMYDCELTKLAILLGVSKDYFVKINYMYKNNEGLKDLEAKYNIAKEKYKLQYDFATFLYFLDYIYCVDLLAYKENKDKENIINGKETEGYYVIYSNMSEKISLARQRIYINEIDISSFLSLVENNGDKKEFAKYVIDNEKRAIMMQFVGEPTPESSAPKM